METFAKLSSKLLAALNKLGIYQNFDLLLHPPLRYEDETQLHPIATVTPGRMVLVEGEVVSIELSRRGKQQFVAVIQDHSGQLRLRLLHFYPAQVKPVVVGRRLRLFGEVRQGFHGKEMIHPRIMLKSAKHLAVNFTPIYPSVRGLSQGQLRKLVEKALQYSDLEDTLPQSLLDSLGLPDFATAVRTLHAPPAQRAIIPLMERTDPIWQRLKFDELLAQQLSMRLAYQQRRQRYAPALPQSSALVSRLLAQLPFALTAAQQRAFADIGADLQQHHPMQRLLQGDVGCGKTIIAALAALQAIDAGWQVAFMAPTEILAEQHYQKLSYWLKPLGIPLSYFCSAQSAKSKQQALAALACGSSALAIGTHALFQEQIHFSRLALVIVDEQHRFGVQQRLALRQKGASPHLLMMSATPIPRTLAMSYYADLDLSIIDELPLGRQAITTHLITAQRRDEVIAWVRAACARGQQVYWVCPLIEASETLQLQTALETYQTLSASFTGYAVGLVHGKMKATEKAAVMQAFSEGSLLVLVATTVIEVGVDVANASVMVIENAERMGLSQLHQLRGRVGRGKQASHCILLYGTPLSDIAKQRLRVIFESQDGFKIAREDLRLRGPGEFLGARQSGVPLLRFADPEQDHKLLVAAKTYAIHLIEEHPKAVEKHLQRWLAKRQTLLET